MTRPAISRFLRMGLTVFIAAALLIRITVRDCFALPGTVFYATPWPVLVGLIAVAGCWWFAARWRRTGVAMVLVGLLFAGWWFHVADFDHPETGHDPGSRVMFWNVSHGWAGWLGLANEIRDADADLIGLVEADDPNGRGRELLRRSMPGYEVSDLHGGIGLLTRGHIESESEIRLGSRGRCMHCVVRLAEGTLDVVVVDFMSNPFRSRRERFEKLNEFLTSLADRRILVLGDFNTPTDSIYFDPIRARFNNAFETAGRGLYVTWPVPLPVLAIDQIWVSSSLDVERCRLGWTRRSDHRPVFADLARTTTWAAVRSADD